MKNPPYTLTNDSVTIIWGGKSHTVKKGAPNFIALRNAVMNEDWDNVEPNLTARKSVLNWAKGNFTIEGESVLHMGKPLPQELSGRILRMSAEGLDPQILLNFWEKLQNNPSMRSVTQLYSFLLNAGIPFTKEGNILAYKSVRDNYLDHHSGQFLNEPGSVHEMSRNEISDDPNFACHEGFHVGALEYASSFGSGDRRIVICEVNPADVVCVPYDSSSQKMRVCRYEVVGEHSGAHMSSLVEDDEVIDDHHDSEYDEEADPLYDDGHNPYEEADDEDSANEPKPKGKVTKRKKQKAVQPSALEGMSAKQLLDQPLADLRHYAAKNLKIIGASKIPGGKVALVSTIMKTRKRR